MPNAVSGTPTIGTLADFGAADVATAGGKGANLGELLRAGFPVPDGFIVGTGAYMAMLAETGLAGRLAELLEAGAGGAEIRAAFARTPVPAGLAGSIREAYRRLGGGPVAVRSSATAEDLPGAAFAGQQDSYLNIRGDGAVVAAVAECWASLWTDRAIAYRRRQGIDPHEVAIAVVVQELVDADVAGVMFSANPVTGRRSEVVVDAGRGLGEAVVSGLITPEHYLLDETGRLLDYSPGVQSVVVSPGAAGGTVSTAGGGTPATAGAPPQDGPEAGPEPCLGAEELARLAGLARQVAAHFGRPQDLEWALAGGRLYLLQARPMTALPPEPQRFNFVQRKVGPFYLEMFQQRPYPLDVSGWFSHGILAMLGRMAGSVGVVFPTLDRLLPEEDGVVVRLVPPVPRPTLRSLAAPVSVARRVRRFRPAGWTEDERFVEFRRGVEALSAVDPALLDWGGLLALTREVYTVMAKITALRVSYLPGSFVPQLRLRLMLLALGRPGLAPALIAGAPTRTSQANQALEELAGMVRADQRLLQAFTAAQAEAPGGSPAEASGTTGPATTGPAAEASATTGPAAEASATTGPAAEASAAAGSAAEASAAAGSGTAGLLRRIGADPDFAGFAGAFSAFLSEYGHRETVSVVLSSSPTFADAPEVVLGLITALLGERRPTADQTGAALSGLLAHPVLRVPFLRGFRRRLLAAVREAKTGMAFREDSHFYATMVLPPLRRAQREMGRRLRRVGVLDSPEQVYHLRYEELTAIADPDGLTPAEVEGLRRSVAARALKRRELEGIPLLDPAELLPAAEKNDAGALLTGTPASRGTAAGPVRIISGPADFALLRSGEILVCPYTNPSWTPLFQRAAAVVVDTGGLGSHAAIVAREYGIPAVMGTRNGTSVLADGTPVVVDGTRGRVLPRLRPE